MNEPNQNSFEVADVIVFNTPPNQLPYWTLRNNLTHSEADIYPFGATVTAWRIFTNTTAKNLFFVSRKSDLTGMKSIRGGIPIIFPQFHAGALPTHGFARNNHWEVIRSNVTADGTPSIAFQLNSSPETRAIWNYQFQAEYQVTLGNELLSKISITNTGDTEFVFQFALHTYFSVADISAVSIHGLKGLTFIDKTKNCERVTQKSQDLSLTSHTDSVYLKAPNSLSLTSNRDQTEISITKSGLDDAVVWNPWAEKVLEIKDMQPDDYKRFVCVEAGQIDNPVILASAKTWSATQSIASAPKQEI